MKDDMPTTDDVREHAEARHITFSEAWQELCGNYLEKQRKDYHKKIEKVFKDGSRSN